MCWSLSNRIARDSWLIVAVWLSLGIHSLSSEEPRFANGLEIFEHDWVYEPPTVNTIERLSSVDQDFVQQMEAVRQLTTRHGDGLGPMHNATSCASCHEAGGGAGVDRNVTLLTLDPRSGFLSSKAPREETREHLIDLYPGLLSSFGVLSMDVVVHEKSARPFYDQIRRELGERIPGGAPESWFVSKQRTVAAIAQQPVLAGRSGEIDFYLSQRNSPPLFGLGLIDKVETSRMSMVARSQSRRSNGKITGRLGAGKFGWRAQTATLDQFVRGACAGELGLQVTRTPQPADAADETYFSLGLDLEEPEVNMLVSYVRSLPEPRPETRLPEDRIVIREGEKLFGKVGCNACHVENLYPARGVYSDLLLHDMGDLLQAPSPAPLGRSFLNVKSMPLPRFPPSEESLPSSLRRGFGFAIGGYYGVPSTATPQPYPMTRPAEPRFPRGKVPEEVIEAKRTEHVTWDMLQREWRTPPLWGVADSAPYLHDGRAATLDAAIRWHGGEASEVVGNYRVLSESDRAKIIAFLKSLRAPVHSARQPVEPPVQPLVEPVLVANQAQEAERLQTMAEDLNVFDPLHQ